MIAYIAHSGGFYQRLATALRRSIEANSPGWQVYEHVYPNKRKEVGPDDDTGRFILQLEDWVNAVSILDTTVALMDADLLVLESLSPALTHVRDIGVTQRDKGRYNSGLVIVKPTVAARAFLRYWLQTTYALLMSPDKGESYRKRHGSVDQGALAIAVSDPDHGADVYSLDCQMWNACLEHWPKTGLGTHVVHIKGELRRACLGESEVPVELQPLVDAWRQHAQAGPH